MVETDEGALRKCTNRYTIIVGLSGAPGSSILCDGTKLDYPQVTYGLKSVFGGSGPGSDQAIRGKVEVIYDDVQTNEHVEKKGSYNGTEAIYAEGSKGKNFKAKLVVSGQELRYNKVKHQIEATRDLSCAELGGIIKNDECVRYVVVAGEGLTDITIGVSGVELYRTWTTYEFEKEVPVLNKPTTSSRPGTTQVVTGSGFQRIMPVVMTSRNSNSGTISGVGSVGQLGTYTSMASSLDGVNASFLIPAYIPAGEYTLVVGESNTVNLSIGKYPGTVNVITRLGNWPVSSAGTCVSTLSGPNGSNTGGCVRSLTNQPAGTYTLKWNGGYPAGADTTKTPTVSPVRFLGDRPAGENPVTFYVDFKLATTTPTTIPTISIISRLDGRALSTNEVPITCNVSLSTPKGIFPGPCSRTVTSSGVGTYAIRWSGSFPTGADTTKRPTVTSAQTLGTNNLVFYVDFAATPVAQPSIGVTFVSADTSILSGSGANDDTGIFRIKYKVTAVGGDAYISSTTASAVNYIVDRAGVPVAASAISASITNDTDWTMTPKVNFLIKDGDSETFTLTVSVQLGGTYTAGMYRTSLTGIKWGTADDMIPEYTYTNLDGFKTSYVGLNLEDIQNPANKSAFTASLLDALKTYVFGFGF